MNPTNRRPPLGRFDHRYTGLVTHEEPNRAQRRREQHAKRNPEGKPCAKLSVQRRREHAAQAAYEWREARRRVRRMNGLCPWCGLVKHPGEVCK